MKFESVKIQGLKVITPDIFKDGRGYFMEAYHAPKFHNSDLSVSFVQDNQAGSVKNVLRGLHFQTKFPQGKMIQAIRGEIFDVAVDIRPGSPTFKQWHGIHLSSENHLQFYVPPGFAHGYCVISDYAEISYKCTDIYHPEYETGIIWNDPDIDIQWPISTPILSQKDISLPRLNDLLLEEGND